MRTMRFPLIVRLKAYLVGGECVWLRDFQGEVYASIARIDPFGHMSAPSYPLTGVGHHVLLSGGKVEERSYMKEWRFAFPGDRA